MLFNQNSTFNNIKKFVRVTNNWTNKRTLQLIDSIGLGAGWVKTLKKSSNFQINSNNSTVSKLFGWSDNSPWGWRGPPAVWRRHLWERAPVQVTTTTIMTPLKCLDFFVRFSVSATLLCRQEPRCEAYVPTGNSRKGVLCYGCSRFVDVSYSLRWDVATSLPYYLGFLNSRIRSVTQNIVTPQGCYSVLKSSRMYFCSSVT